MKLIYQIYLNFYIHNINKVFLYLMILNLPDEIIMNIVNNLDYYDLKEFLQVNKHLNGLMKEFFNDKFFYIYVQSFVNKDIVKFRRNLIKLNDNDLEKVFFYTFQNIEIVWLNKTQGFSNLKYIYECILLDCRVNTKMKINMNDRARHVYEMFYRELIKIVNENKPIDRFKLQQKINNISFFRTLHTNFISFKKYD